MRTLGTLVFFLFLLATCWLLANRASRRDKLLNGPLALAILIGFQAVLLNVLSPVCGVSALSLVLGNLAFIAVVVRVEVGRRGARGVAREYLALVKRHVGFWAGGSNPPALLVAPLLIILLYTAVVYPPNNWDSMTYHMSRVLSWMQNGSVSYFPTSIDRQNVMNPGAEYLILLLQALSGADYLANLVQFVSYYLLVAATPSLLRLLGIQRRIANWGLVLVASLPMGILQATNTQSDLVAASLAFALAAATLRLWHTHARAGASRTDIVVVALLGATAYLVKPTAVLAAVPFLLVAAVCYCRAILPRRRSWRGQALNLLCGALVVAVVAGPDLYRKKNSTGALTAARNEVYPLAGRWREKLMQSIAGIRVHVIPTEQFYRVLAVPIADFLKVRSFQMPDPPPKFSEDLAGNPFHILFAAVAILVLLFRYPMIPRAGRWSIWCVGSAWILLHATVRCNPWISRIQTPVFMLFPCFLAAWATTGKIRAEKRTFPALLFVIALPCLCYGIIVSTHNESRHLQLADAWQLDRDTAYYVNRRAMKSRHDQAIAMLEALQVRTVGLWIGADDYDYPLSWRLYRSGLQVRHATSEVELAWADAVYAPGGVPPGAERWTRRGEIVVNPRFLEPAARGMPRADRAGFAAPP